jgi:hypothetical protein
MPSGLTKTERTGCLTCPLGVIEEDWASIETVDSTRLQHLDTLRKPVPIFQTKVLEDLRLEAPPDLSDASVREASEPRRNRTKPQDARCGVLA